MLQARPQEIAYMPGDLGRVKLEPSRGLQDDDPQRRWQVLNEGFENPSAREGGFTGAEQGYGAKGRMQW